jgi:hypothetical protein
VITLYTPVVFDFFAKCLSFVKYENFAKTKSGELTPLRFLFFQKISYLTKLKHFAKKSKISGVYNVITKNERGILQ